jgi:uncharacterized membrane protein YqaE (UPF0057 family)
MTAFTEKLQSSISKMNLNQKNSMYKGLQSVNLDPEGMENSLEVDDEISTVLLVILAILLPPLAVYLVSGIGTDFWISLILTLLFILPGIIFALIKVLG